MVKLVAFPIIKRSAAKHPVLQALEPVATFDYDSPRNWVKVKCEMQYVIPKAFADDPVVALLSQAGLFDFEAQTNTVYLPVERAVARKLGVSPQAEPPLVSYAAMIGRAMRWHEGREDFQQAAAGDEAALARLDAAIKRFQATTKYALLNGDAYAGDPNG